MCFGEEKFAYKKTTETPLRILTFLQIASHKDAQLIIQDAISGLLWQHTDATKPP